MRLHLVAHKHTVMCVSSTFSPFLQPDHTLSSSLSLIHFVVRTQQNRNHLPHYVAWHLLSLCVLSLCVFSLYFISTIINNRNEDGTKNGEVMCCAHVECEYVYGLFVWLGYLAGWLADWVQCNCYYCTPVLVTHTQTKEPLCPINKIILTADNSKTCTHTKRFRIVFYCNPNRKFASFVPNKWIHYGIFIIKFSNLMRFQRRNIDLFNVQCAYEKRQNQNKIIRISHLIVRSCFLYLKSD